MSIVQHFSIMESGKKCQVHQSPIPCIQVSQRLHSYRIDTLSVNRILLMSGTKQTCEKYDYRFEIRREMMNTKRELKLEEMALVTGGGNLLIKHSSEFINYIGFIFNVNKFSFININF